MVQTALDPRKRGVVVGRFRPARARRDRVVGGVAAGIAAQVRLDPILVRLAFVVLGFASGAGALLYVALWVVSVEHTEASTERRAGTRQIAAVSFIVAGLLLILRAVGWWPGDATLWPLAVAALGAMFVWARSGEQDRLRWTGLGPTSTPIGGPAAIVRLLIGCGLVAAGGATLLNQYSAVSLANVALPITVTVAGLLVALGPWLLRLSKQVSDERRERIRSEERSAMAAHLHDSVLQTLAMIQRTGSHRDVVALARRQERDLRAWLYGRRSATDGESLSAALEASAERMEEQYRIPFEVVVVGDAPIDDALYALVQATTEAMNNAGAHSGAPAVSVYAEVETETVTAYVRDEGEGFDIDAVPSDRRGISDSLRARIERHGGRVQIASEAGAGTEVHMDIPRANP
jgi:signal transduction histidine kinase